MKSFRTLISPMLITIFMLVVVVDFIFLPILNAFHGHSPYTAYTTVPFWASYGAICVSYIFARTKEKLCLHKETET